MYYIQVYRVDSKNKTYKLVYKMASRHALLMGTLPLSTCLSIHSMFSFFLLLPFSYAHQIVFVLFFFFWFVFLLFCFYNFGFPCLNLTKFFLFFAISFLHFHNWTRNIYFYYFVFLFLCRYYYNKFVFFYSIPRMFPLISESELSKTFAFCFAYLFTLMCVRVWVCV